MKDILLTGSSGYIGKNFIHLYGDKYNITECDKKSTGSISDDWFKLYDHIIHLAGITGKKCEKDLNKTIEDNILSTNIIVNGAKNNNIPITFASSLITKPEKNIYNFTKNICEKNILTNLNNSYILRFSNIYGGIDYLTNEIGVIAKFLNNLKNDNPLVVNGDGLQVRDFIHINDICKAIHKTIEIKTDETKIIEIGTGIGTSILKLAKMVGSDSFIYKKDSNDIGIKSNIAMTYSMNKKLKFETSYLLNNYIKENKVWKK